MTRTATIKLAILRCLKRTPEGYCQPDDSLIAEVSLAVQPRPTLLEIEEALSALEISSDIVGIRNDLTGERKWRITDTGKLALATL